MRSPLTPAIFDLATLQLETSVIESQNFQISLYLRYMTDILLFLPEENVEITLNSFIAFHGRIKITVERLQNIRSIFLICSLPIQFQIFQQLVSETYMVL